MNLRAADRPVAVALVAADRLAFVITGILSHQATERSEPRFGSWSQADEDELCESLSDPILIAVLATSFDPETAIAGVRLLPYPSCDLGGAPGPGSAWHLHVIDLMLIVNSVSGLRGESITAAYFQGHPDAIIPYSSIHTQLDVAFFAGYRTRPERRWYPFDSYAYDLTIFASARPWSEDPLVGSTDSRFHLGWYDVSIASEIHQMAGRLTADRVRALAENRTPDLILTMESDTPPVLSALV